MVNARLRFTAVALVALFAFSSEVFSAPATGLDPAAKSLPAEQRLQAPDNLRLPPASAVRTTSGLRYVVLNKGKGTASPVLSDTVTIDYIGWDFKGRAFDSTVTRGQPSTFPLTGLIKGWQEGVPLMQVGDTFRFWIPGKLAYDDAPGGDAPKGKLVFDVTLHAIEPVK